METIEDQDHFKAICNELESLLVPNNDCDLMTLRTKKMFLISNVMTALGVKWKYLFNLFKTQSFVHSNIAKRIMNGEDDVDSLLAQGFVRNEKLLRIFKNVSSVNDQLMAVDGLMGNLSNGPNFDYKHYLQNLKIDEPKSTFDDEPEYKRKHVLMVRLMYKELVGITEPSKHIYNILREIFKMTLEVELPVLTDFNESLPENVKDNCMMIYLSHMLQNEIEDLFKSLKVRGEKRNGDEESPNKIKKEKMID